MAGESNSLTNVTVVIGGVIEFCGSKHLIMVISWPLYSPLKNYLVFVFYMFILKMNFLYNKNIYFKIKSTLKRRVLLLLDIYFSDSVLSLYVLS